MVIGKKNLKKVVFFDTSVKLRDTKQIDELTGKLKSQKEEERKINAFNSSKR